MQIIITMAHNHSSPSLHEQEEYPCPVCHYGKITNMTMMETFSCSFCQHIFTINFERKLLKMIDSQIPLSWLWNGRRWQSDHQTQNNLGLAYILFGLLFIGLPTGIIALGTFIFPPLPESPFAWFTPFWIICTFIAHLFCFLFVVIEYYQWPLGIYLNALKRKVIST